MFLDRFNLNQLRIFECVYRKGRVSEAARELGLTQPGVSQHIKAFEDALGVTLFDRIQQRLVPTTEARDLYRDCSRSLFRIEQSLVRLRKDNQQLMGTLCIGMPIEFGNNVVIPLLSRFSRQHPELKFKLRLGFASEMNEMLLRGKMDFAFVDEYGMDPRIAVDRVREETLELCISPDRLPSPLSKKQDRAFFEALDYVEYQQDAPLLRMWFSHHLKQKLDLQIRASVMDVQAITRFILHGLGAGIIPGYLYERLKSEGHRVHRFVGRGEPVRNHISVAYLRERTHSHAAGVLLQYLRDSLKPEKPEKPEGITPQVETAVPGRVH